MNKISIILVLLLSAIFVLSAGCITDTPQSIPTETPTQIITTPIQTPVVTPTVTTPNPTPTPKFASQYEYFQYRSKDNERWNYLKYKLVEPLEQGLKDGYKVTEKIVFIESPPHSGNFIEQIEYDFITLTFAEIADREALLEKYRAEMDSLYHMERGEWVAPVGETLPVF